MICIPCRKREHESCEDIPRLAAARKGQLTGVTDTSASSWCYCHHTILSDPEPVFDRVDC